MSEEELRAKKEEVHHTQTHAIYGMVKRMVTPSNKTIRIKKYLFHTVLMFLVFSVTINFVQQEDASKRISRLQKQALKIQLLKKSGTDYVWFNRQRIHEDKVFAAVDKKHPAQFEIWNNGQLVERWHWRVEHDINTYKYGEYITRCVANYDRQENYTGYTCHVQNEMPTGNSKLTKTSAKALSLSYKFCLTSGELSIWQVDISGEKSGNKITFKGRNVLNVKSMRKGFVTDTFCSTKHDCGLMFVNTLSDDNKKYLEYLSKSFKVIAQILPPADENISVTLN